MTWSEVKNLLTYVLHKCISAHRDTLVLQYMAGDRGEMREVYLRANLANIFQAYITHLLKTFSRAST